MVDARRDVSYAEIDSDWGHDAFLVPNERYESLFRAYMNRVAKEHGDAG